MLFLLKDISGRALLVAQAASQADADRFGRTCLQDFCGESLEIEVESLADAEEFWGVRTVSVAHVSPDAGDALPLKSRKCTRGRMAAAMTHVWVKGPELPDDVESAGLLTPEDRRDLTLDHIMRTSSLVARVEILKFA